MTDANDQFGAENMSGQAATDDGLRRHMLRVYNYMGLGLLITGGIAYAVAATPAIHEPLFGTPLLWVVLLSPFAFVLVLSLAIHTMPAPVAHLLFWLFSATMGLSISSLFLIYTGTSVAQAFFVAAAMFGAMSLYGYTTKNDLTRYGSLLVMGLVGVIVAAIVNVFLQSSALGFAVSIIGVLVFLGLTAWDTQRIKEQYSENADTSDLQKLAVLGALSLYLNFVNLFQLLLSLTGQERA